MWFLPPKAAIFSSSNFANGNNHQHQNGLAAKVVTLCRPQAKHRLSTGLPDSKEGGLQAEGLKHSENTSHLQCPQCLSQCFTSSGFGTPCLDFAACGYRLSCAGWHQIWNRFAYPRHYAPDDNFHSYYVLRASGGRKDPMSVGETGISKIMHVVRTVMNTSTPS